MHSATKAERLVSLDAKLYASGGGEAEEMRGSEIRTPIRLWKKGELFDLRLGDCLIGNSGLTCFLTKQS